MVRSFAILSAAAIALTCLGSCKEQGCTDIHSISYYPEAEKDDGSCMYKYATEVLVISYETEDVNGVKWDPLDDPDLYMVYSKTSSSTWDHITSVYRNAPQYVYLSNQSNWHRFTNEPWRYQLRDDDGNGSYDIIMEGTFNPLSVGNNYVELRSGKTHLYMLHSTQ